MTKFPNLYVAYVTLELSQIIGLLHILKSEFHMICKQFSPNHKLVTHSLRLEFHCGLLMLSVYSLRACIAPISRSVRLIGFRSESCGGFSVITRACYGQGDSLLPVTWYCQISWFRVYCQNCFTQWSLWNSLYLAFRSSGSGNPLLV